MASLPEVTGQRALILDANILLRAILGIRVRNLIEHYSTEVTLLTPETCVSETRKYLPRLCEKRHWPADPALQILDALLTGIQIVDLATLTEYEPEARARIAARDPDDWPAIALSIATSAPVWTEDPDFFGTGVATWTTRTVEIYLAR